MFLVEFERNGRFKRDAGQAQFFDVVA